MWNRRCYNFSGRLYFYILDRSSFSYKPEKNCLEEKLQWNSVNIENADMFSLETFCFYI